MNKSIRRANAARVINYLLRMEEVDFDQFIEEIKQQRIVRRFYRSRVLAELKRPSRLLESLK